MTEHSAEVMAGARAMWDKLPGRLSLDDWSANSERYCQAFAAGLAAWAKAIDGDEAAYRARLTVSGIHGRASFDCELTATVKCSVGDES